MSPPYDPRSVANLLLDCNREKVLPPTNLALQKLLYFAHGLFLLRWKQPLIMGHFEAWQYGPVNRATYQAFKSAGSAPIRFRATGVDLISGEPVNLSVPEDPRVIAISEQVMDSYGRMTPGRLVEISHAKHAPWDHIVRKGRTSLTFGFRIPDSVILERFANHKISVSADPKLGEPSEDSPLA